MSLAYVRHRASELEKSFRIRNVLEQGACLVALVWCAVVIATAPHNWIKIGVTLLVLGIGYGWVQWRRRVATQENAQAFESINAGIVFYTRELERKRDLHRTLWRWYLLPMIPGTAVILLWNFLGDPHAKGTSSPWIVLGMLIAWVTFSVVYERGKAAQYQREIEALASLGR